MYDRHTVGSVLTAGYMTVGRPPPLAALQGLDGYSCSTLRFSRNIVPEAVSAARGKKNTHPYNSNLNSSLPSFLC